jgi:hypothetical protein
VTLVMTLVTPYGAWASTDHRLTAYPGGAIITNSSVKHVVVKCQDGAALISYTGLGRLGNMDISRWMREVLRGESRTVDGTLIDLREQATARFGLQAQKVGVMHAFLAGAYIAGRPWAVEIRNVRPATAFSPVTIQPVFDTGAIKVDKGILIVAGSGRDAVLDRDRVLLTQIVHRKPRRPEEFMKLLADVNRRAAESRHPAAKTITRSCTVVFMPPSGDGVKNEWYGPEEDRHLAPSGFSHVFLGIDFGEMARPMMEYFKGLHEGRITQEEFNRRNVEAANRSVKARGRR